MKPRTLSHLLAQPMNTPDFLSQSPRANELRNLKRMRNTLILLLVLVLASTAFFAFQAYRYELTAKHLGQDLQEARTNGIYNLKTL